MDPRLQARRLEVLRLRGRRRLRALVVVVALVATAVGIWWLIERSPLFDVDEVSVRGAANTPVETIVEVAGITRGQPLVEVDTGEAKAAIATLPWVDEVTASRSVTGEVGFTVTERVPVAVLPGAEGWLMVDSDGRVLEVSDVLDAGLVVVDGARWNAQPGGWIGESALPALEVASLLPSGLRPKVASIQVVDHGVTEQLELVLFGGGAVLLGDTDELDDKFLSALTMLVRVDLRCVDEIDVRAPAVPVLTRIDECS